MLIWVTRTAPDNFLTARALRGLGHRTLVVPALNVRAVPPQACGADDPAPDVIVFTSVNGVRHHAMRPEWARLPVFAVGRRTADVVRRAGYARVTSADGDVEALKRVMSPLLPARSAILHYGPREAAGDLPTHFAAEGHRFRRVAVYETIAASDGELGGVAWALPLVDGIAVHSPRGATRAVALARQAGWAGEVWALSPACAAPFAAVGGARARVAAEPTERALLALVPHGDRPWMEGG